MKVLYIGCVTSSFEFLKSIFQYTEAELVGGVTKINSNYNADHHSLHNFCEDHGIDWIDYRDNEQLIQYIHEKSPDIIYCFGWSHLLPEEVYSIPKLGAVGYHPTLLPKNRGRHPIIWTIALGLKETGSTFFKLTETPDAGDILSQRRVQLNEFVTANSLYEKLITLGKEQVVELTNQLIEGSVIPIPQDESKATYWRKRGKRDGLIDWRMSSITIINLVNALTKPYVGAHFEYQGKDVIVWRAEQLTGNEFGNIEPGKIFSADVNEFTVKTSDGYIKIVEFEGEFAPKEGIYL